jgi:hypothetical protein
MTPTVEQFKNEYWRLNNLYKIADENGDIVTFKMNEAQTWLYRNMHYLNLVLKARQLGFTTFIDLFILDRCLFNPNVHAGIIAHNLEDAKSIFNLKIKDVFERLPDGLKNALEPSQDSANTLEFKNGSLIRVGTSMRSGTLQYLHVSEYGKICSKYPEKAREIRTGALNTVHAGNFIFIESTAEGQEGHFYNLCEEAQTKERKGDVLTTLDFKFHFFPWWKHPGYQLPVKGVVIPQESEDYFTLLKSNGIHLSDQQKAWYVKKAAQQEDDMKREYPSTPEEAFESSVEGAYYGRQMAKAEEENRVGAVPHDPALEVETWWDIGMRDSTSIWFVQRERDIYRVIDFYQNSGEGLPHYASVLQSKAKKRGFIYSQHVGPHDLKVRELGTGKSRLETARKLGVKFRVCADHRVEDGIEAVRNGIPKCWFDEEHCAEGIKALKNYRKEWDDKLGTWRKQPRHDENSHAADAFRYGIFGGRKNVQGKLERLIPRIGSIA